MARLTDEERQTCRRLGNRSGAVHFILIILTGLVFTMFSRVLFHQFFAYSGQVDLLGIAIIAAYPVSISMIMAQIYPAPSMSQAFVAYLGTTIMICIVSSIVSGAFMGLAAAIMLAAAVFGMLDAGFSAFTGHSIAAPGGDFGDGFMAIFSSGLSAASIVLMIGIGVFLLVVFAVTTSLNVRLACKGFCRRPAEWAQEIPVLDNNDAQ
jgi:hypothetical protein